MALLRSAARALRLRQQGFLLPRIPADGQRPRLLSSSGSTERHKCFPSSDPHSRDITKLKRNTYEKNEDIIQRISTKVGKITDDLDKHSRLLQELKVQIKNNNKTGEIDLTPTVVLVSASFLSFVLYKYVLGD